MAIISRTILSFVMVLFFLAVPLKIHTDKSNKFLTKQDAHLLRKGGLGKSFKIYLDSEKDSKTTLTRKDLITPKKGRKLFRRKKRRTPAPEPPVEEDPKPPRKGHFRRKKRRTPVPEPPAEEDPKPPRKGRFRRRKGNRGRARPTIPPPIIPPTPSPTPERDPLTPNPTPEPFPDPAPEPTPNPTLGPTPERDPLTPNPTPKPTPEHTPKPTTPEPTPNPTTPEPTPNSTTPEPTPNSTTPEPTPNSTGNFNIELMNMGNATRFDIAFQNARARWEKIILNDLPDWPAQPEPFDLFEGLFDQPVNINVDDMLIGYEIGRIDVTGGIAGFAGSIFVRNIRDESGDLISYHTISGIMVFDIDDFNNFSNNNDAEIVILHEMGHVLGIGGITNAFCAPHCNREPGTNSDFNYYCPNANREYTNIFPTDTLLLENDGSRGTRCVHWEEDSFQCDTSSELMTGGFERNKAQPLTAVTIGALQDLSFEVNYEEADQFVCGDLANVGQLVVESENLNDFIERIEHTEPIALVKEEK